MEAGPVQALIDDALLKLRLLACVTDTTLAKAGQLSGILGEEVAGALDSHRAALEDPDIFTAELTAARLARVLQQTGDQETSRRALRRRENHPGAARALRERFPPPPDDYPPQDVATLAGIIAGVRAAGEVARRRLTTTLEEENGRKAQFNLAVDRERKAAKELQTLERQLASEREDRAALVTSLTAAEARARRDLAQATNSHDSAMSELKQRRGEGDEAANASFQARFAALQAEVTRLRTELEATSRAHKEEETSWRKKRNKAEQEVANWVSEYDKDMGSREAVLDTERAAYAELAKKLAATLEQVHFLKESRLAHEKSEQERLRAVFMRAQKQRIAERAAKTIQAAWKVHQASKPKPPKEDGKGGKDKKGGKKK